MRRVFLLFLLLALPASARATWANMDVDELVRESDLVVVGTLRDVSEHTADEVDYGQGRIEVREVIWGRVSPGDSLLLRWSNHSGAICPRIENEQNEGKEGIWLLTRDGEAVAADHPGRFVGLSERRPVEAALARSPVILRAKSYWVERDGLMSFTIVYRNVSGAPREFPAVAFEGGRLRLAPGSRLGVKLKMDDGGEREVGLKGRVETDAALAPVTVGARDEHRVQVSLRELLGDGPKKGESYEVALRLPGRPASNTLGLYVSEPHIPTQEATPAAAPRAIRITVSPARQPGPAPLVRAGLTAFAALLLFPLFRRLRAALGAARLTRAANGVRTWQI